MNSAPRSITASANGCEKTRPPTRSRPSNTSTSTPARVSSSAAARPAKPAPTTITRRGRRPALALIGLDLPAGKVGQRLPVAALVQRAHEHAVRGGTERDEDEAGEPLAGNDEG